MEMCELNCPKGNNHGREQVKSEVGARAVPARSKPDRQSPMHVELFLFQVFRGCVGPSRVTSLEGALKTVYDCEDAAPRQFQECTGWSCGRFGSKPSTFPRCSTLVPIFTAAFAASTHAFEELDSDREDANIALLGAVFHPDAQ